MSARRIARTAVPPVGANSFAWRLSGRYLWGGDKHQSLTPKVSLTPQRPSHIAGGLIARGPANKFAPTKAAVAVQKLLGWRKKLREYPARAVLQGLLP